MGLVLKRIKNNVCSMVSGTDGDVYIGTFVKENDICVDCKYIYVISFKSGTQARGHEVVHFSINRLFSDGSIGPSGMFKDDVDAILKEVLRGF